MVDTKAVSTSFAGKNTNDNISSKEVTLKSLPGIRLPLSYLHRVRPPFFDNPRKHRMEVFHQPWTLRGRLESEVVQVN